MYWLCGTKRFNQACMFIIDFKVKNIHISKETNNKLNSRNAVTMINSVVDQKKKSYKKETALQ